MILDFRDVFFAVSALAVGWGCARSGTEEFARAGEEIAKTSMVTIIAIRFFIGPPFSFYMLSLK
jgi:hypothetical protein